MGLRMSSARSVALNDTNPEPLFGVILRTLPMNWGYHTIPIDVCTPISYLISTPIISWWKKGDLGWYGLKTPENGIPRYSPDRITSICAAPEPSMRVTSSGADPLRDLSVVTSRA